MADYTTELGSLDDFRKGGVHIINDDPRNYVFSNAFEVAGKSAPFERVCVAKTWSTRSRSCARKAPRPGSRLPTMSSRSASTAGSSRADEAWRGRAGGDGAHALDGEPEGPRMGRIRAGRGHLTLLPAHAAYRISAEAPSVVLFQTMDGPLTIERWAEICQTGEE